MIWAPIVMWTCAFMRREKGLLMVIGPGRKGIPSSYDARNAMGDSLPREGQMYSEMAIGPED